MQTTETKIAEIIQGVECRNVPLDENQLYGAPLLEEIIKLAAMTAGFYAAEHARALYRAPYPSVKTQADLKQLMEFACKDFTKIYIVGFCQEMLRGSPSERDLAQRVVTTYMQAHDILQGSTSRILPTVVSVLTAVRQSVGERKTGKAVAGPLPEAQPK